MAPADEKAMTTKAKWSKKKLRCHYCRKLGHFKRDCPKLAERSQSEKTTKPKSNSVTEAVADDSSDGDAMVVSHSVSVGASASWIVDSGATCHMCSSRQLFAEYCCLQKSEKVKLGDGRCLKAVGRGTVVLLMNLPGGETRKYRLQDTLYVPDLSYNLVSVSKASEAGKVARFDETGCEL